MPRIKLFLMRHSKSCSNHTRSAAADTEDPTDPAVIVSQSIRDPGLSVVGARNAKAYGPVLKAKLLGEAFDVDRAIIGASRLRRAKDTARFVFSDHHRFKSLGHFAENGELPENTPAKGPYTAPDWNKFLGHLSKLVKEGASVVVVGHGSYLRSLWPRLTGHARKERLNNMDGILLDIDVSPNGFKVHSFKEIPYTGPSMMTADKCHVLDIYKIVDITRDRMTRKQRGGNGSTGMPLTYHTGNQPQTYSTTPTGVGLTDETATWIRPPMTQSGGRRSQKRLFNYRAKRSRKSQGRRSRPRQEGGFTAEIMGSFAANGARLLPVAAYLGYNMYKNQKSRKTRRN
jgi:broad specificity phosphatase PhoE